MKKPDEIIKTVSLLLEYEELLDALNEEIKTLRDELKEELECRGVDALECGCHTIRYQTIISNRLDSTAMKKAIPQVYMSFLRPYTSRRFTIV